MNAAEAAARLSLTTGRIRQLARAYEETGEGLKGERVGRDWVFRTADVEEFAAKVRRGPGRKPKRKV